MNYNNKHYISLSANQSISQYRSRKCIFYEDAQAVQHVQDN